MSLIRQQPRVPIMTSIINWRERERARVEWWEVGCMSLNAHRPRPVAQFKAPSAIWHCHLTNLGNVFLLCSLSFHFISSLFFIFFFSLFFFLQAFSSHLVTFPVSDKRICAHVLRQPKTTFDTLAIEAWSLPMEIWIGIWNGIGMCMGVRIRTWMQQLRLQCNAMRLCGRETCNCYMYWAHAYTCTYMYICMYLTALPTTAGYKCRKAFENIQFNWFLY